MLAWLLPAAERTGSRVSILGGLGNESHGPPGQFYAGVASSGGGAHGFEGEYPGRVRQRVSRATVCPLGQPNKAIGLESPIEPWLAHRYHAACRRSGTARRTQQLMDRDPAQRNAPEQSRTRGWMSDNYPFLRKGRSIFS